MVVTDDGIAIDSSDVHSLNAPISIVVTEEGISIDFKDEHL